MLRLFGKVDGQTNRRHDRAMYLTIPFDVRNVKPPHIQQEGVILPVGAVAIDIIQNET